MATCPAQDRDALLFLLEHMPARDVRSLTATYLLENVRLAREALAAAPWKDRIPLAIYHNDVLPYASLSERRDDWRAKLREICAPLVADCRTPGEAAHRLNQKLFPLLKVKYSTGRRRPDQGPLETMGSGIATCTGLSILLVDACRSVGVPARVVGTPMWANLRGNHTWVEVWDDGWQFTGAAEPDGQGLNRGWFVHDAAQARADVPQHAIYASSFARSDLSFPLVWAPAQRDVPAVNVTERYVAKAAPSADGSARLLVQVLDAPGGLRVPADVVVAEASGAGDAQKDRSRGETADLNDFAAFRAVAGRSYRISATADGKTVSREWVFGTNASQVVTLTFSEQPVIRAASMVCYAPPPVVESLTARQSVDLTKVATGFFSADGAKQAQWKFPAKLDVLLAENEPAVRQAVWKAFAAAPIHDGERAEFATNEVRFGEHRSPYTVKTVGVRPTNGWALFIAMHGGGNAPKRVNDSQWAIMQRYYRDHPEVGGYLYVALRAPNDTWNGFYDDYVYPLVARLVRNHLLFADVDPNKVFLMGYSHGGYGAYAIGPKMPDRFAAIHASAAAATDGETAALNLRNTVFSAMVGERDTMYGRLDRNRAFLAEIERLRGSRQDIYPVTVEVRTGHGHSDLPDRDLIPRLAPAVRHPVPRELTWRMTDTVVRDFFWLHVPNPAKGREVFASCHDNRVMLTAGADVDEVEVRLDERLVDLSKPVAIELNGATTQLRLKPSLRTLCETLVQRGDPELAFTATIRVRKEAATGRLLVDKTAR